MTSHTAESVVSCACTLGEGPVWYENALWWVDIEEKRLHRWLPGTEAVETHEFPERIGFAVPASDGTWRVGLQSGIHAFDPGSGDVRTLHDPEPDLPHNRFNDGKSDPRGRLWAGTMSTRGEKDTGALYRLAAGRCDSVVSPVTISNGLAWDTGKRALYYIDSPTRQVAIFNYDPETGDIANRRTLWSAPEGWGSPDGMTIDKTGKLWVAFYGGYRVACIDPQSGKVTGQIDVPAPNVTSCTFGRDDLDVLYITTARAGMKPDQLEAYPLAGNIFAVRPGVSGLPVDLVNPS
jgi:sugar lactone lactonase YvrE